LRIGIPRALLYFDYWPLWKGFFEALSCQVLFSSPTTVEIANQGVCASCDEVCYPVKVLHGHVLELAGQVDALFIPKIISVQSGTYSCPKLIGLTDMVHHSIPNLPPIIAPSINLRLGTRGLYRALKSAATGICSNPLRVYQAWQAGLKEWHIYRRQLEGGRLPDADHRQQPAAGRRHRPVAVIGHPYNLYDSYLNLGLLKQLNDRGYQVYTPEMLSDQAIATANRQLRKQLFWSLGRRVMGGAIHFAERPDVLGTIHVASFGCGLESLVADMAERASRRVGKPFMLLTMDEHSGEAGMLTRLEAFLDMLEWREQVSCV
jgi:predicted nucleotide-binding protein (sugar kinase/HSP70/actin superfamily)